MAEEKVSEEEFRIIDKWGLSTCTNAAPSANGALTMEKLKEAMRNIPPPPPKINIMVGCPYFNGKIDYGHEVWYHMSHSQYRSLNIEDVRENDAYLMLAGVFSNGFSNMRIFYWGVGDERTMSEEEAFMAFMLNALTLLFAAIAGILTGANL